MSEPLRSRLGLALAVAPVLGQFLVVFFLGVNTPIADEIYYTDFIRTVREGGDVLPLLWWQHNEHRVVPVKLTMMLLEPFFGWNLKAEMYVSALLAGLVVLGLWRLYRHAGGADLLLFAPVAWLFCNLSQYENMLYGLLMCHYQAAAGVVWTLVFLARRSVAGFALACLCGVLASLSLLNGLLVWPIGLLLLLAWGERRGRTVAWFLAGAATFAVFFHDWEPPPGLAAMSPGLQDVPRIGLYALSMLGAPLAGGSVAWGRTLGLALLTLTAALVLSWLRRQGRERLRDDALLFAPVLFALLTCAVIAGGRAFTTVPPLESRYVAYTSLAFAGAYLLASRAAERRGAPLAGDPWLVASLALLLPAMVAANLQGFSNAKAWRHVRMREQFLLHTFDLQPDAELGPPHLATYLRGWMAYLRAERLTAFSEPQRVLLLTRFDEGEAAGPVLPGRPVELRLSCPVDVLRDVEVTLSREGPKDASQVSLSVWAGTRRLAVRDLPVSVLPSGWASRVLVPLPRPLRECQGRELTLRIESPDATPATRVTVWTYPRYYDSVLRQGDGPLAPGRSLGLFLNAYHFGL